MPKVSRIVARGERNAGLVRLSIGVGREPGDPIEWRARHVPSLSLHDRSDRVQRLVETLCRDMWGELANGQMTHAAFVAIDDCETAPASQARPAAAAWRLPVRATA